MTSKTKGILVPPLGTILIIVLGFIIGAVVATNSTDGWAALGALLMVFFAYGLFVIIVFITGLILYYKNKMEFGLGLIIGMAGTLGATLLMGVIISIYNALI